VVIYKVNPIASLLTGVFLILILILSAFIGRTVATQLATQQVCEGTVVAFTRSARRYTIQYTDGATAMLTTTALKKVLLPVIPVEAAALAGNVTAAAPVGQC
jgi:hypothetical protein